ncbi:hypothetical protein R3W88_028739 [Solanum pinnatisectum]|uniref:F-box associated beta-propeller type 1 domain-containing protein n=1 Tax=Solanum pinnatisectum TaxID=50273 RepID=A0AAV9K3P4_9SOLN|nr:hypothetical protein R3W88_028739 [Solanum pinnatisectum]
MESRYKRITSTFLYSEIPPIDLSLYGLGYDSITNDYKVVRIDRYPDHTPDEILVLKSGSFCWVSASKDNMYGLVFVHGALHWFGCDFAGYYLRYILVSFNISNEMYEEIPIPNVIHSFHCYPGASVLGGMLCCHCNENGIFNLWIMKEYGVKESWIKSFTIPNEGMPIYRFPDGEVLLICNIVKNGSIGSIFMISDGSFRLSNRVWPLDDINSSILQDGFVYTESLISPKLNN